MKANYLKNVDKKLKLTYWCYDFITQIISRNICVCENGY